MFIEALVLEEGFHTYPSKNGQKTEYRLSIRDHAKTGLRCENNFKYVLGAEELDKYKGKLRDQHIRIEVTNLRAGFNGDFTIEGKFEVVKAG